MPSTLHIGDNNFRTQTEATTYVRAILNSYTLRGRVEPEHEGFLRALLSFHPEYVEKLAGQKISHFEVRSNRHGTRSFYLVRHDGSADDFSYPTCIRAAAKAAAS